MCGKAPRMTLHCCRGCSASCDLARVQFTANDTGGGVAPSINVIRLKYVHLRSINVIVTVARIGGSRQ